VGVVNVVVIMEKSKKGKSTNKEDLDGTKKLETVRLFLVINM